MAVLLVTYDLNRPGKDYPDLLKTIKEYSWAKISESSYAINTTKSPIDVFNQLKPRRPPKVLHLWPPKLLHPAWGDLMH